MRTFFTLIFMLLITVPLGIIVCRSLESIWLQMLLGLIVGLMGANIANIVYDVLIKTWMDDDGN